MNFDNNELDDRLLQVGEIARLAGVSVRTLHHYQEIGLLTPISRSASGYRLYDKDSIIRLQQITSLRAVGMSLAEIQKFLDDDNVSTWHSLRMHIFALDEQIANLTSLRDRLKVLLQDSADGEVVDQNELLNALKEINEMSKHFTPEQIEQFKKRSEEIGPKQIAETQQQWQIILEEFGELAANGENENSERALASAEKALLLFQDFSGGCAEIEKGVMAKFRDEGASQIFEQNGMSFDQAGWNLMQKAMAKLKNKSESK